MEIWNMSSWNDEQVARYRDAVRPVAAARIQREDEMATAVLLQHEERFAPADFFALVKKARILVKDAYEEDSLEAPAGNVAVAFTNDAPVGHDVVFEQDGSEVARSSVLTGGSETVGFKAKPGEYTYFCSLPGHREAGMEGTLTVK